MVTGRRQGRTVLASGLRRCSSLIVLTHHPMLGLRLYWQLAPEVLILYKNQRAYLAIPVGDIKGLMILLSFKPSYRSVQISPRFL